VCVGAADIAAHTQRANIRGHPGNSEGSRYVIFMRTLVLATSVPLVSVLAGGCATERANRRRN